MEKELSIIIPHYNSHDLLERLIVSIPSKEKIQVIAVDDKSNDEHRKWDKLKEKFRNVEFYENTTPKKGAGVCRNIGLDYAKGKWVLFADADDYFIDGFYEKVEPFFEATEDIIFFSPQSIVEATGEKGTRHIRYERVIKNALKNPDKENTLLLKNEWEGPCSKLIRNSLIQENNIRFDDVKCSNDVMFSAKTAFMAKEVKAVKESIYMITQASNTLTTTINVENAKIRLQVFINKYEYVRNMLTKKELACLNMSGIGWYIYIYKNKLPINMYWYVSRLFLKHRIPIINKRLLTISYWKKKFSK